MSGDHGVSAFPDGDNLFKWVGTLVGPKDTVSEEALIFSWKHFVCYLCSRPNSKVLEKKRNGYQKQFVFSPKDFLQNYTFVKFNPPFKKKP